MAAQIKTLNGKRSLLLKQLTTRCNQIKTLKLEDLSLDRLQDHLDYIMKIQEGHQEITASLFECDDADHDHVADNHAKFEDIYETTEASLIASLRRKKFLEDEQAIYDQNENSIKTLERQIAVYEKMMEQEDDEFSLSRLDEIHKQTEGLTGDYKVLLNRAIVLLDEEDDRAQLGARFAAFLGKCLNVSEWLSELTKKLSPSTEIRQADRQGQRSTPKLKLPAIDLPKFDGSLDTWITFRDTFKSIVHSNADLTPAIKFRYLKSSITDKYSPISHIPESDDGYQDAFDLVIKKYDDKRRILDRHFSALIASKKMQSEDADDLQKLLNEFKIHTSAMERAHSKADLYEALIANLLVYRLDAHTRDIIETDMKLEIPTWSEVETLLEKRIKILSAMPKPKSKALPTTTKPGYSSPSPRVTNNYVSQGSTKERKPCDVCKGDHNLRTCSQFFNMETPQRLKTIKDLKRCVNCMGPHDLSQCKSTALCRTCNSKHHTLLHSTELLQRQQYNTTTFSGNSTTLLSTAIVKIQDHHGQWHDARAILDTGSDANFIRKTVADALKIPQMKASVQANGIGETPLMIDRFIEGTVASSDLSSKFPLEFLVTKTMNGLTPISPIQWSDVGIPFGITLADPTFNVPGQIDILIGNELYHELMLANTIKLTSGAILRESKLGWIVAGKVDAQTAPMVKTCNFSKLSDLKDTMEQFYKLEDYRNAKGFLSDEERYCEEVFEQTHKRNQEGRFIVQIPLRENISQLSENFGQAYSQFISNERRLQKNERLKTEYIKFMKEYEDLGHMEKLDLTSDQKTDGYYLPHHAVESPDSTTTKVRVVFNASSKTRSGLSFNDTQCIGPKIQTDVFTLNLKFRQYPILIKADIAKMYRQILVEPGQRRLQKILWRNGPEDPISIFRLNTLTYGTASASFESTRCLKQLAIENAQNFPRASEAIEKEFYVDDLMSGAQTVPEAIKLYSEISDIIASGAMKLRKICSNNEDFLAAFPKEDQDCPDDRNKVIGALGLKYNPVTDQIQFDVKPIVIPTKITKRHILSEVAKIHDPEGLLGPVTFNFKKFIKTIWMTDVSWDQEVPEEEATRWIELAKSFTKLNEIRINRQVFLSTYIIITIHGFSDASETGFGAVVYIQCRDADGTCYCNILAAKSRIAPKERRSIARLELCGAVVLVNLMELVEAALIVKTYKKYFWMDSAIALHWIRKSPGQLQPFVANRVSQIQELSENVTWRHVRGEDNPADLISRGLLPEELVGNSFWWHGPKFLELPENEWPASIVSINPDDPMFQSEFRKIQSFVTQAAAPNIIIKIVEDSSQLSAAKNKVATIKRIFNNLKAIVRGSAPLSGQITVAERAEALKSIIRLYQKQDFAEETKSLTDGRPIPQSSKLKRLDARWNPDERIIRVGGRLDHAGSCFEDQKHQIIIPKCHLSSLIIREIHEKHLHAGQQATLGHLRMQFWPIQAKNTIRKELHNCIACCKARPKLVQQFMGQLPPSRITPSPAFFNVGVDYAGPFSMKTGTIRSARIVKVYIALFVCMATKAIHLEVVSDLSTKAFIAALDRFSSRRGLPRNIYSDNGTNFVGSSNELKSLYAFLKQSGIQEEIYNHLAQNEVTWHFIPPRAPEHGGLWEAGVKSMKYHLCRTTKEANLTFEEFYTVLCKIEAILNSRPLTSISDDPNDFNALTPGHFIIQRPLTAIPQHDLSEGNPNRLQRWDRIIQIQQHFWKRWSREYLHQLQVRTKRFKSQIPISINQLVLMQVDNVPSMQWPTGRIIALQPGKDGISRVATVKTSSGSFIRPVSKLALLPIEPNPIQLPAGGVC